MFKLSRRDINIIKKVARKQINNIKGFVAHKATKP